MTYRGNRSVSSDHNDVPSSEYYGEANHVPIVSEAWQAFKNEEYLNAEILYQKCCLRLGHNLLNANRTIVENRIISRFTRLHRGKAIDPQIYYCIPIMNRLDDIKRTLSSNLNVASHFSKVKLILNIFDQTSESYDWVCENHIKWIEAGILMVNQLQPLPFWHFSWAKNSFKRFIGDEGVYSSLDGDNYLSIESVARTKQVFSEYGPAVVHHFSGVWGDGSSGRVSVTSSYYKKYGYENRILPRQFDEMSLILKIITTEKEVKFFCREDADIFTKSTTLKEFQEVNAWRPTRQYINLGKVRDPENPKDLNYASKDEVIKYYSSVNSIFCLLLLAQNREVEEYYEVRLKNELKKIAQSVSYEMIAEKVAIVTDEKMSPERSGVPTLYSVLKNDELFIDSWLTHYRSLGVKRFIIIDDNSDHPLVDLSLGEDVFVFKATVGNFKNFKAFWLQCLMRRFQQPGSLCLCADSDEYLDIPRTKVGLSEVNQDSPLESLYKSNSSLRKYGRIPGLLVDLMPIDESVKVTSENFIRTMNYCVCINIKDEGADKYMRHPSVKWAFAGLWKMAYKHDLRYHIYGTFDCLRKFPIFLYGYDISLNQGFHALARGSDEANIHGDDNVIPIRHYKMLKIISGDSLPDISGYFNRTAENMSYIYNSGKSGLFVKWKTFKKCCYDEDILRDALLMRKIK